MAKIKTEITGKLNLLKNDRALYEMDLDGLKMSLDCPKCKKKNKCISTTYSSL